MTVRSYCENPFCKKKWPHELQDHHIIYRSHKWDMGDDWDTAINKITVCGYCSEHIHRSRENMIAILEELEGTIAFRWEKALAILTRKRK